VTGLLDILFIHISNLPSKSVSASFQTHLRLSRSG
jgi:hypothetical protein